MQKFLNCALEVETKNDSVKVAGSNVNVVLLLKDFLNHVVTIFKTLDKNSSGYNFFISISNAIPTEVLKCLLQFSLENVNEPVSKILYKKYYLFDAEIKNVF